MKKIILMVGCLLLAGLAMAQHAHDADGCDCPSCQQKGRTQFTLPGLEALNKPADCEQELDPKAEQVEAPAHEGHDHAVDVDHASHDEHAHAECEEEACAHEGHDPDATAENEDHEGHDHSTCSGDDEHAEEGGLNVSSEMAAKLDFKVSEARGGLISKSATFPAEIVLNRNRSAAVSPRYASVIRQVFVEIGDEVKKGDVLASLENRETLSVYTVSAPLDGVIVSRSASIGESAGEESVLFEVADLSSVWADISIFPKYRHLIKKGMPVEFIAHDGHRAKGNLQYLSPLVSHETRTFMARCVLDGAGEDFTPGAFVRARIVTESAQVPVRIEREALQLVRGSAVVFISDEHGFESRDVVAGMVDAAFVEIRQGLKPGERYVSHGSFALKAEMITSGMDPHAGHGH